MKKQTLKEMLENIVEYDGAWHKGDKDGNCEQFTMVDLKELLAKQKEEIERLIVEEILICHKENQPTSRLTSLSNKLEKL